MRKPVLGIIRHPFKRTVPVAEPFHAVRVCAEEPFRTQGAPLKGMDEFVEMKRLVTRPNPLYKLRVQVRDTIVIAHLELNKAPQANPRKRRHGYSIDNYRIHAFQELRAHIQRQPSEAEL
jgi:hypothetical protein